MVMEIDPEVLLRSNSFPSSFKKGSGCTATMTCYTETRGNAKGCNSHNEKLKVVVQTPHSDSHCASGTDYDLADLDGHEAAAGTDVRETDESGAGTRRLPTWLGVP